MKIYITTYFRVHRSDSYIIRISFQPYSLTGVYVVYVDGKASRVISNLRSIRNQDREFEIYYDKYRYYVSDGRSTLAEVFDLREIFYRFTIPYTTARMKMIKDLYTLELL